MDVNRTVVIAGKNRVAVECLKDLLSRGLVSPEKVRVLPVSSDSGEDDWQPSLRKFARQVGIQTIGVADLSERKGIFVSVEYDRILHPSRFPEWQFFNIHFSALPAYKGCWTAILPILHGAKETGVTLHEMDAGIDTGPIIDQVKFRLDDKVTAKCLYSRLMVKAVKIFARNIESLVNDCWIAQPQPEMGASYFSRADLDVGQTEIDLSLTFDEIDRKVRGFYFPEFQTATLNGLPIRSVRVYHDQSEDSAVIVSPRDKAQTIAECKDCLIEISHGNEG